MTATGLAGVVTVLAPFVSFALADDAARRVTFEPHRGGGSGISAGGSPVATWSPGDASVRRPYFFELRAPGGAALTRNHPPKEGADPTDHADMHPGVWLAFGDVSGADFWRNKGPLVVVRKPLPPPQGAPGRGSFEVVSDYKQDERILCTETCRYTVQVRPAGFLIVIDSAFRSDAGDFSFGDQEEMGLGIRVATPLAAKNHGRIYNSEGRVNEQQVWGREADWCDYGGRVGGTDVGVMLIPDPQNYRRCRFHARDYGLLVANPFAIKAFDAGAASRVVVRKGETLRLRFGVLLRASSNAPKDLHAAYADCRQQMDRER